jgi:hypothetical protein
LHLVLFLYCNKHCHVRTSEVRCAVWVTIPPCEALWH